MSRLNCIICSEVIEKWNNIFLHKTRRQKHVFVYRMRDWISNTIGRNKKLKILETIFATN